MHNWWLLAGALLLMAMVSWGQDKPSAPTGTPAKPATDAAATVTSAAPPEDPLVRKAIGAMLGIQRYSWEQGVAGQALWEWGDKDEAVRLAFASLIYHEADGRLAAIGGGATDPAMGGEYVWRAAEMTKDPKLVKAADDLLDFIMKRAPRAPDGTNYHVFGPEIWVDSFNCVPPYEAVRGNYDEAIKQIEGFRKRLWNPAKKMYSHMYNENSHSMVWGDCWGVGNGWAAVGLARVIKALPPERADNKKKLVGYLTELLDGCIAHQRADGLFNNVLDNQGTFVETNTANMLAYAIYTGLAGGWLPDSYRAAADKMRDAARAKVDDYGFVQGVCGAPDFGHPGIACEGQAWFILMEAAHRDYIAGLKTDTKP